MYVTVKCTTKGLEGFPVRTPPPPSINSLARRQTAHVLSACHGCAAAGSLGCAHDRGLSRTAGRIKLPRTPVQEHRLPGQMKADAITSIITVIFRRVLTFPGAPLVKVALRKG